MSVNKIISQLETGRTKTDVPLRAGLVGDFYAQTNALYEKIMDEACPGANAQTLRGHRHNGEGDGRGFMRGVNGMFLTDADGSGPPLLYTHTTTSSVSMAKGDTALFPESSVEGNYEMGVAYVSPGVEAIRVEVCIKVDLNTYNPRFRVVNLTDYTFSSWVNLTASSTPSWYNASTASDLDLLVTRTDENRGRAKRIELDIEVDLNADPVGATVFALYCAFPFEPYNQQA